MKVLLVEDDLDQLDITAYMLRRDGFVVAEASDAVQALRRFRIDRPDIVVLNLGVSPVSGLEVLRQMHVCAETPIVVVSAREDRQDSASCFELGAEDFITKRYLFKELTLRLRAILRRAGRPVPERQRMTLEVAELRLDPQVNEVASSSVVTRLTPTEFRIFFELAENAGRVVTATRLFAFVRAGEGATASSLRSHVCHLRKKLGLDGGARGSIACVPGVGYVFHAAGRGRRALELVPDSAAAPS